MRARAYMSGKTNQVRRLKAAKLSVVQSGVLAPRRILDAACCHRFTRGRTMAIYQVQFICDECGETHPMLGVFNLNAGPAVKASIDARQDCSRNGRRA